MVASDDRYRILPVLFGLSLSATDRAPLISVAIAPHYLQTVGAASRQVSHPKITLQLLRVNYALAPIERPPNDIGAFFWYGLGVQAAKPKSLDISSASTFGVTRTVRSAEDGGNRVEQLSLRLDL
jgi:hypothetical protein